MLELSKQAIGKQLATQTAFQTAYAMDMLLV